MLKRLSIENYALIDSLEIEFNRGLNTITGETGAGKSLLLGALSVVLGGRTDVGVLRDTEKNCVVEAEFEVGMYGLESFFDSEDIDYEADTVIRRVINPAGKSRAYINDIPVNISVLKELSARLIDVHSQHQTLLLADNRFQLELVDSVAAHGGLMAEYVADYEAMRKAVRDLEKLRKDAAESKRDYDFIKFQTEQLAAANLREGEQTELEQQFSELTHAAEILEALGESDTLLNNDESGVLIQLKNIEQQLAHSGKFFARGDELSQRVRSLLLELRDVAAEVSSEAERVEVDPEKLERTSQRLDMIYSLQQKHHAGSVEELLELYTDFSSKLEKSENFDNDIVALEKTIADLKSAAAAKAGKITKNRLAAAPKIEEYVKDTLTALGMPNIRFAVSVTDAGELTATGADAVSFLFNANKNGDLQPVEQCASGGEMSRLMLALKSLVAQHSQLPTIIFDEIDTGISGEVADKMGQIISRLADRLQIINITHLPQVASKGEHHYFVYKSDSERATNTHIRKLSNDERIEEIAKMISGTGVSEHALNQARILLKK